MRGLIFDLDGTLVDSKLDFDAMRVEMNLPPGQPILESLAALTPTHAANCREILREHERRGAACAVVIPGVLSFLEKLRRRGFRTAVLTRNSRLSAQAMLSRLGLADYFSPVITRDDGRVKPDPWAIHHICARWNVPTREVAMIGDFVFDVVTGRNAGAATVLYTRERDPDGIEGAADADFVLRSFERADDFLIWLGESG